jgi:transcription antitermination factor NusG
VLQELRDQIGADELHVLPETFALHDRVQISGGSMHGLMAVITQVMPAKERVKVLLDFMGQQTSAEVPFEKLIKEDSPRRRLL